MADPRAFISFDFDNNETDKNLFAGQCSKKSPTPFSAQDRSSKEALPQSKWEDLIEGKIGRCHMMFVLVGQATHKASGVAKELVMAAAQDVPIYGVYIDDANTSTKLPAGLQRGRCISWDWKEIAAAVRQMMKEGKNA